MEFLKTQEEITTFITQHRLVHPTSPLHLTYLVLILSLVISAALLPLIRVEVTVKSPGLLRPPTEISQLKSTSSGIIKSIHVRENDEVIKGQLLIKISSPVLEEKATYLRNKLAEINGFRQDLEWLTDPHTTDPMSEIVTPLYKQALVDHYQKLTDRKIRLQKARQDYERNSILFDQKVIAKSELENYQFEFDKASIDFDMLKYAQLNTWQRELTGYEKDAAYYEDQLVQTQREIENLDIIAPVDGSIQNLAGIYAGSPVFLNQDLLQISPNNGLVAEVFVAPHDIGLLRDGMRVRMQISAFNYNQWGLVEGNILEISKDVQIRENQPVFEIRCSLDRDRITLRNGYEGKLKKGMTLQARFSVVDRNLWQLLYDKMDDWMNPNLIRNNL